MSFLTDYLLFTRDTESPAIYHKWCGLSAISHLVGRKVWTQVGDLFEVWPNMYIVLVGAAGIAKTTAMNNALKLVNNHESRAKLVGSASSTKEAMVQVMGKDGSDHRIPFRYNNRQMDYSQYSIFANELVSLLGIDARAVTMIDFLTDIWDRNPYRDATKGAGSFCITNPYVTMLACMTTETAKSLLQTKLITSGMSRRCVFIVAHKNEKPVAWPELSDLQRDAKLRMFEKSKEIVHAQGQFQLSDSFLPTWRSLYDANFSRTEREEAPSLKSFLRSKPELILKIAMCLSLSEDPKSLILTGDFLNEANLIVSEVEMGSTMLFSSSGRNPLASIGADVLTYVELHGPLTRKRIYNKFTVDADMKELDQIIDTLVVTGKLSKDLITSGDQSTLWVGTPEQIAAKRGGQKVKTPFQLDLPVEQQPSTRDPSADQPQASA